MNSIGYFKSINRIFAAKVQHFFYIRKRACKKMQFLCVFIRKSSDYSGSHIKATLRLTVGRPSGDCRATVGNDR